MPDSEEEDPAKIAELKAQSMDDVETMPMFMDTQVFANALVGADASEKNRDEPKDESAFLEFLKVSPPKKVGCLKQLLLLSLFEKGWWDHFLLRSFS